MVVVEIPNDYGPLTSSKSYVLLAATSTFFVNFWHTMKTVKARKASGVPYPNAYAPASEATEGTPSFKLNCAQRAHSNFIENLTPFLATLFIAGVRYPIPAASLGFGWLAFRVVYTIGYLSKAGPKGRRVGYIGSFFSGIGLALTAGWTAVKLIQGQ
ncbi:hypothetical protein VPNG_02306 [Cytospora leucostoma]|uniref:Uncharacterized protein n=1 Tax=Cytospora leucostoma TaxID=1230097 RepID=A0A423XGK1_9PEZI|nr:hypothetical protein VPNG_02306 [Cytospora leucostoma]